MLPKQQDQYYDIVRDVRQNKGSILKASVDYIRKLKNDQLRKKGVEEKLRIAEAQNRKLLLRIQEHEAKMKAYGIPLTSSAANSGGGATAAWKPTSTLGGGAAMAKDHVDLMGKAPPTPPVEAGSSSPRTAAATIIGVAKHQRSNTNNVSNDTNNASKVDDESNSGLNHLSTKQLEDLMEDDDCQGPVSNGDPMLSSPHLLASPASSSAYSSPSAAAAGADSMDLAA